MDPKIKDAFEYILHSYTSKRLAHAYIIEGRVEQEGYILINLILKNSLESKSLAKLRDSLLPKLLSGEVEVENL